MKVRTVFIPTAPRQIALEYLINRPPARADGEKAAAWTMMTCILAYLVKVATRECTFGLTFTHGAEVSLSAILQPLIMS